MSESIHGHQVMELMLSIGRAVSREELKQLMVEQFGEQAKYHTCSAQDMDAQELITFLERRGKFIESEAGVETAADRICQH
ncbi:YecH family protein [Shewanella sp. AS1]|uniref:YecH family metal-binding protein n=1 Tax=Shewanella sp. AS1 TaxID=2907626 RepID=UPI001F298046|nr:YecH family metal-binding protein [Shewanella sp. AS1]MCE9678705.1 YecH family protein [Shewanella sp. AS1]